MSASSFRFTLDLVVKLIDATTGNAVDARQIVFLEKGEVLPLVWKDVGLYILMNHGRENMTLCVRAKGFEERIVNIDYSLLDENQPKVEIPLIPLVDEKGYLNIVFHKGVKKGLKEIVAVNTNDIFATVNQYSERKVAIKFINSRALDEESFALVNIDKDSFEEFSIDKQIDPLNVKLKSALLDAHVSPGQIVSRIIRGAVNEKGEYKLAVRYTSSKDNFLVRYKLDGEDSPYEFETIDLQV